jgi:streptogramin lyase
VPCTVGLDANLDHDRNPSACARISLPGRAEAPITTGPDGRPWFLLNQGGRLYPTTLTASEQVVRLPNPLPPGQMPRALAPGGDGAVWYAGPGRYGRITRDGQIGESGAPGDTSSIVRGGDGVLWVAAGSVALRLADPGNPQVIPLVDAGSLLRRGAAAPTYGAAPGPGGFTWIAAGGVLRRVTATGVRNYDLPDNTPADGQITVSADGSVWYVTSGGWRNGHPDNPGHARLDPDSGDVRRWDASGTPYDLVAGPGRNVVWMTVAQGGRGTLARIGTVAFPAQRYRCPNQNPAACIRFTGLPQGDKRNFDTHSTPHEITASADQRLYYTEGAFIGRMTPFRGMQPCYDIVTRRTNFGCGRVRTKVAQVTHSGVAYVHSSCPRHTFNFCRGWIELRTLRGKKLGKSFYVQGGYDNVRLTVRLPNSFFRRVKRGAREKIVARWTAEDAAGLQRSTAATYILRLRR